METGSSGTTPKGYITGTVAHEGEHGSDQKRFGMPRNGSLQNWNEKRAAVAQALTYKGAGLPEPDYGVLTPSGKIDGAGIETTADQSTGSWCKSGGDC
jgi:hypothetical protein